MKVIATLPLGYKEKLMVVKVGGQQLLVGVTPQQVNFLYRLEEPLDESQPQAFSEQLGKLMGKHENVNWTRWLALLSWCSRPWRWPRTACRHSPSRPWRMAVRSTA